MQLLLLLTEEFVFFLIPTGLIFLVGVNKLEPILKQSCVKTFFFYSNYKQKVNELKAFISIEKTKNK